MTDNETAVATDDATIAPALLPASAPAPLPAGSPAFTPRELRLGAIGIGLGLVVGIVGSLLVASVAGGIGSLVTSRALADAATACDVEANSWIEVGDEGRSISMKSEGEESDGADISDIACIFGELDTPDSVINRVDSTRALDGRQTATWNDFSASWGYHPDDGLDIVIEVVEK